MAADENAALAFLRDDFAPEGPWLLATFKPKGKSACIRADQPGNLRQFVQQWGSRQDVYFLPGIAKEGQQGQPPKEAMKGAAWLWADLDPRAGEDEDEERQRILALLRDPTVPKPTLIIDSGRGYWGFWRLREPCLDPDVVEAHNLALANALGADQCHNCNRVARLPGTVNRKTERRAQVVERHPDRVYALGDMPAPRQLAGGASPVTAEVETVEDLQALVNQGVRPETCVIINHGDDPNEPARFPSRSEAVFHVCCELVRAEIPEAQILGVLLDQGYGIADSIYTRKDGSPVPNPDKYARRQVAQARERVTQDAAEEQDPELRELNERHAVLTQEAGKCRVLSWETTELDDTRQVPILQTFEDFRNRYMHRRVAVPNGNGGFAEKPLGEWWLRNPQRRQYLGLKFLPGEPAEVSGYLNLWRGWAVEPKAGDWSRMEAHVREVLAAGDDQAADYILRWCAWAVQNPDKPAEVALVFRGGRGTGKGLFLRELKRLFGQHGLQVNAPAQLTGRFNSHLRDCCLLFADEAIVPGHKEAESALKGLITEPELTIEGKGVNVVQARNRLHVVMASNDEWVVPAGMDERRFAIFDVAGDRAGQNDYFGPIYRQMEEGGRAAMLHDLRVMLLGDWHPRRDVPQTAALREQKELSLSPVDEFILGILEEGNIPGPPMPRKTAAVYSGDQGRDPGLYTHMRQASPRLRNTSDRALGTALKKWGCRNAVASGGTRGWQFPPLSEMRGEWERRYGRRDWGTVDAWAQEEEVADAMPF